jgi:hypothetical protein
MNGLIDFLTTQEMIVVYILVGIASVLYLIAYIFDKTRQKRKQRQNTRELRKIVDEVAPEEESKDVMNTSSEPVLVAVSEEKKEELPKVETIEVVPPVIQVEPVSQPEVASTPSITASPEVLEVEEPRVEVAPVVEEVSTPQEVEPEVLQVEEEQPAEPTPVKAEEELQYTSIEPDPTEAQAELMRLTETLEKAEEEVKNIDLTAFEEEQEQNAIISLDELMTRGKAMYESGELEKLEDEGNEPISLQDLEERMKQVNAEVIPTVNESEPVIVSVESGPLQMKLDDFQTVSVEPSVQVEQPKVEAKPVYQEHKKFKSSPVISPVFGIEKPEINTSSDIELENTANYEKLDEEIRKTNEFLMTLKELQKKLD